MHGYGGISKRKYRMSNPRNAEKLADTVDEFIEFWEELADILERKIEAGKILSWVDREKAKTRIGLYRMAADALEQGAARGVALCICCLKPRNECASILAQQDLPGVE
jgi:phosphoglycolate phosphatase-like HAD superfamily hydrolase